jgi:hypothetical protein
VRSLAILEGKETLISATLRRCAGGCGIVNVSDERDMELRRKFIVGVMGPGKDCPEYVAAAAFELGSLTDFSQVYDHIWLILLCLPMKLLTLFSDLEMGRYNKVRLGAHR